MNRAAEELAALTQATRDADDRANNLATADRERGTAAGTIRARPGDSDGDGKASFALPEAFATAIGAGWLLGPVGGLALGIAQGIIGKQQRQNALDEFAREQEAIGGIREIYSNQFEQLRANTTNKNDIEQLNAMQAQQDAAFEMMVKGSPAMQQKGMEMLATVQGQVNEYTDRQETQRIEADANDAQLRRDLEQQGYDRYTKMEDDFTQESQGYEDITMATNLALEALERGSPSDLWAATILVNKALDPTSVVRQEEAEAIGALGSLWAKAGTMVERALNGQSVLPQQRRELSALLSTIQNGAKQLQLSREARYKEQLIDAEVPFKYWNNFTRVNNVPAYEQGPIASDSLKDKAEGIAADVIEAGRMSVHDGAEALQTGFEKGVEAINKMAEKTEKGWLDIFVPDSVTANRPKVRRTN